MTFGVNLLVVRIQSPLLSSLIGLTAALKKVQGMGGH
jgi:hypothetical protein